MSFLSHDEIDQGKGDFKSIATLLKFSGKHRSKIFLGLGLMIISYIAVIFSARYLGQLVELGIRAKNSSVALKYGLITLSLELGFIFFHYFGRKTLARSSLNVIFDIRELLFNKLQTLPMKYFDTQPLGRTVTRLTHDVENLETFFSGSMPRLIGATLSLILVSIAMVITHWQLGLVLFLCVIPSIATTYFLRNPIRHYQRDFSRNNSAVNSRLNELLNGINVIRSFGLEKWSQNYFRNEANAFLASALKINQINSWARPTISYLALLPIFGLLIFGTPLAASGAISVGLLITFLRYCERFYRPINTISQEVHQLQNAFAYLERVLQLLTERDENALVPQGTEILESKALDIQFQNVWLRYSDNDPWVLKGLNLHIKAGSIVGLVGRTGSGKTSTVSLLSRLYEYQNGEILIHGRSIRNLDRSSLRSRIGFISQDVIIFEGTLRNNLSLGYPYTDTNLLEACKKSGLEKVMHNSGYNLDTKILDKGLNLSVGERQLLALTRIFLSEPGLVILDEATANIDPVVEASIQEALKIHLKTSTCLIIAHRLNTLELCDRIAILKNGTLELEVDTQEFYKNHKVSSFIDSPLKAESKES